MPEVSQLMRAKPTTTVIDMGDGDAVKVTFDRNKITTHWDKEFKRRVEEGNNDAMAAALAEVILTWDVTENGEPWLSSSENISRLALPAQAALHRRIIEASMPSEEEGKNSERPSSSASEASTSPSSTSQNGTDTSTLPAPSESLSST